MNSDQNEFETLRKLMALKRHEQPPPNYLDSLSSQIINRIERGEGRPTFWERLSGTVVGRPTLAYALGLTVCGGIGLGAVCMVRQEITDASDSATAAVRVPAPAMATILSPEQAEPALHVASWLGKTNPAVQTQPELSLFDSRPHTVAVSYHPGN